ncbi:four helix bundle protein [Candidatus Pacearchaeota archaeon]|nr:four helix bundle protein [Candidatus Pacearchaeota archaeon]
MRNFKELDVWVESVKLVEEIYDVSSGFPRDEIYGLTSQIRRAMVSVASNISEGCGRRTSKDFVSFLYNSVGSAKEVDCQLIIANRLKYLEKKKFEELENDVNKLIGMLMRFIHYVSERDVV